MNKTIKVMAACLVVCLLATVLLANPGYYPTNTTLTRDDDRMGICFFYHRAPLTTSWSNLADQFFYIDQREDSTDWTQYRVVSHPDTAADGVSIRARFNPYPTGTAWFDDFSVAPITSLGPNVIVNGDFETAEPYFFHREGSSTFLIWADDEASRYHRSLKIDKSIATGSAVAWVSGNQATNLWNRMDQAPGAVLYNFKAMVKTQGVNTNPANDDEKIGIKWEFYSGGGLLAEAFAAADQSVASKDWDTVSSFVAVPSPPDSAVCKLMAGKDATGTVWFDELGLSSDPWYAGVFGWDAETPAGYLYWTAGPTAADIMYDDSEAHSGTHSVKIVETDSESDEIVIYSIPYPVEAGETYLISCWTKFEGVNFDPAYYPSNVVDERDDQRLGVCFFYHREPLTTSWSNLPDQFFYFDQTDSTSDGWVKYEVLSTADTAADGISIRARFNPYPTGTAWFDDFSVQKVTMGSNVIVNGDLETEEPYFFHREGSSTFLIWADDEASRYHRSLKIDKSIATGSAVAWVSGNQATNLWNRMDQAPGAVLYNFKAMVKTQGVNTNPANDDEKIGIKWEFYSGGGLLAEAFAAADQSVASKDWDTVSSFVAVPSPPDSAVCKLMFGKDATGTAWFDELGLSSDPWYAGVFGWDAETCDGYLYWTAGPAEADITYYTTEAHSGTHSAQIVDTDNNSDEIVWYSIPYPVDNTKTYVVSAWVKTAGVNVTPVEVTFQVNMRVQILNGLFTVGTDTLCMRGSVAPLDWSGYANMLSDADGDSIYDISVDFGSYTGDAEYKYVIKRPGEDDRWESIDNRMVTLTGSSFTLDPVYFNNEEVVGVAGTVLFQVDMSVQHSCAFFDPDTHRLTVRGGTPPLAWEYGDNLVMTEVLGQPDHYTIALDFIAERGGTIEYKYQFSKQPDDGAYGGSWEEKPGGGNYTLVYDPDAQGQQTVPERYFGEIGPEDMLAQNVDVIWQVDVRPVYYAIRDMGYWYFEGMIGDTVYSVDSVYIAGAIEPLVWVWDFPGHTELKMYDDGTHGDYAANDSIFSLTLTHTACSPACIVHKYGINGGDNELGFAVNHTYCVPAGVTTVRAPVAAFGVQELGIEEAAEILPKTYMLGKGYPNPFAKNTSISYQLPKGTHVNLAIYNVLGQKVVTLVDKVQPAGYYTANWDGKSAKGTRVANGVYFYSMTTKDYKSTEKLLLIR